MIVQTAASAPVLSESVIIALIGVVSALSGGVVTMVGAVLKNRGDLAQQKSAAIDQASKDLREALTERLHTLEQRADAQWKEIEKLHDERKIDVHARFILLDTLLGYPDPPGAPVIPSEVAKAIGYEPKGQTGA